MLSSLFIVSRQGCRVAVATATQLQPQIQSNSRYMSSTAKVWIDKNTRVICQGFTGKQVRYIVYTYDAMTMGRVDT